MVLKTVLILASVLLAVIENVKINFRKKDRRIIGGKEIKIEKVPYSVTIGNNNQYFFCGGAIISKKHILTAAHCIENPKGKYFVFVGSHDFKKGKKEQVSKAILHPKYDAKNVVNDIAVLFLKSNLKFNKQIQSVGLPGKKKTKQKKIEKALVTGFGRTSFEAIDTPKKLRAVELPIIDNKACKKLLDDLSPNTICAGCLKGGCDSCQGDSGGPLVLGKKIIGIVSYGHGCGNKNSPGVYTDVQAFLDFINKETKNLKG